jgi:hypothetical protein
MIAEDEADVVIEEDLQPTRKRRRLKRLLDDDDEEEKHCHIVPRRPPSPGPHECTMEDLQRTQALLLEHVCYPISRGLPVTQLALLREAPPLFIKLAVSICVHWLRKITAQVNSLSATFDHLNRIVKDLIVRPEDLPDDNPMLLFRRTLGFKEDPEPLFGIIMRQEWTHEVDTARRSSSGVAGLIGRCGMAITQYSEKLQQFSRAVWKGLALIDVVALRHKILEAAFFSPVDAKHEQWRSDVDNLEFLTPLRGNRSYTCWVRYPSLYLQVHEPWDGWQIFRLLIRNDIVRLSKDFEHRTSDLMRMVRGAVLPEEKKTTGADVAFVSMMIKPPALTPLGRPSKIPKDIRPPCINALRTACEKGDARVTHTYRHILITYEKAVGEIPADYEAWVRRFNPKTSPGEMKETVAKTKANFTTPKNYHYGCVKLQDPAFKLCPYQRPAMAGKQCALHLAEQLGGGGGSKKNVIIRKPVDIEQLV